MTTDRKETIDSLPTMSAVWMLLRKAYGTKLAAATLVVVIDSDGHVTVQTLTFPKEDQG